MSTLVKIKFQNHVPIKPAEYTLLQAKVHGVFMVSAASSDSFSCSSRYSAPSAANQVNVFTTVPEEVTGRVTPAPSRTRIASLRRPFFGAAATPRTMTFSNATTTADSEDVKTTVTIQMAFYITVTISLRNKATASPTAAMIPCISTANCS